MGLKNYKYTVLINKKRCELHTAPETSSWEFKKEATSEDDLFTRTERFWHFYQSHSQQFNSGLSMKATSLGFCRSAQRATAKPPPHPQNPVLHSNVQASSYSSLGEREGHHPSAVVQRHHPGDQLPADGAVGGPGQGLVTLETGAHVPAV